MPKGIDVTVRGADAIVANLYAFSHRTRENFRVANREAAQEIRDRVVQIAPKDTGYMARTTKFKLSPDELAFSVGWWREDFEPHGLPFYPVFVEHGTSRQRAQPSLGPAYEWGRGMYQAAIRDAVRAAMRSGGI